MVYRMSSGRLMSILRGVYGGGRRRGETYWHFRTEIGIANACQACARRGWTENAT